MTPGAFRTSIEALCSQLRDMHLLMYVHRYDPNVGTPGFISLSRDPAVAYQQVYLFGLRNLDYSIVLRDYSFFQFGMIEAEGSHSFRYGYYPCPYETRGAVSASETDETDGTDEDELSDVEDSDNGESDVDNEEAALQSEIELEEEANDEESEDDSDGTALAELRNLAGDPPDLELIRELIELASEENDFEQVAVEMSQLPLSSLGIPVRYDVSPESYVPVQHSYAHFHFGHRGVDRIPIKRILSPYAFGMLIAKSCYSHSWTIGDLAAPDAEGFSNRFDTEFALACTRCPGLTAAEFHALEERILHVA